MTSSDWSDLHHQQWPSDIQAERRRTILAIRPKVDSIPLADPLTGAGNDSGVKAYSSAPYTLPSQLPPKTAEDTNLWNQYLTVS